MKKPQAKKKKGKTKKHPCPDCNFCQWCSDERCSMCRHRPKASKKQKKKKHKPLFCKF